MGIDIVLGTDIVTGFVSSLLCVSGEGSAEVKAGEVILSLGGQLDSFWGMLISLPCPDSKG